MLHRVMTAGADEVLATFCAEVSASGSLWTARVGSNIASVSAEDGDTIIPFWSTRARVELFLSSHEQFKGYSPLEVPWVTFRQGRIGKTIPAHSGVGINWNPAPETCCASTDELIERVKHAT